MKRPEGARADVLVDLVPAQPSSREDRSHVWAAVSAGSIGRRPFRTAITRTGDLALGRTGDGAAPAGEYSPGMVPALDGGPLIRVVIAGRRPDVRRALEIRLTLEPDVKVVGSTSSAQTALSLLRALRPNVLLVDADARPEIPAEALARARAVVPRLRVLLLTYGGAGLEVAGADEVVDKSPDAGPLLASVRRRPQGFV
jgi:hypothetical protein